MPPIARGIFHRRMRGRALFVVLKQNLDLLNQAEDLNQLNLDLDVTLVI